MKLRFTIILGYTTMFLWIWMLSELESMDLSEKVTQTIPMFGMIATMWLIYRLECMVKDKKKKEALAAEGKVDLEHKPTTTNIPNEA